MPGSITITLSGLTHSPAQDGLLGPDIRTVALACSRVLEAAARGAYPGTAKLSVSYSTADAVQASATATIVTAVATNSITINGAAFAGVSSNPTGDQWVVGSGGSADADSATNLAAAINASTTARVAGVVMATAASNVVTITAVVPGLAGNGITLTKSGAPITVTGSGFLAGGVGGGVCLAACRSGPTAL